MRPISRDLSHTVCKAPRLLQLEQRTLTVGGKYHCTVCLQFHKFGFSCFTTFTNNNIFYFLVKSGLVKLQTSRTVILPPTASVL